MTANKMLSIKEVAAYFGVSTDTIYRMVRENEIAFLKIRGQLRFPEKNLEGWVQKNLVQRRTA